MGPTTADMPTLPATSEQSCLSLAAVRTAALRQAQSVPRLFTRSAHSSPTQRPPTEPMKAALLQNPGNQHSSDRTNQACANPAIKISQKDP